MKQVWMNSPLGAMRIVEEGGAIVRLDWGGTPEPSPEGSELLREAKRQLSAYFSDERAPFDLPLRVAGSAFQKAVCDAMLAIPLGDTRTYGEIAKDLGAMPQAVGQACGGNPIPIIIPCHRVMGAKGLTGFSGAGGVESKVWLLRHEKAGGLLI
ncbi:methylated-DNA--[protein]-cysteine S-methyltransferase [Shimia sp.]|uniref:methylated-DNA--[protein]-cysteine S-methyltransferase n=1 Tax=Shimia sp. TaxID=1954381 RepID=UPI0032986002